MRFEPKTEKEIVESNLLPAGIYDFEIADAADEISKKGNDMIKLKINVWDARGEKRMVFDYLMESMAFKLRHCCEAIGAIDKYEGGDLVAGDFIGGTGKLKLGIRKDTTGNYPDQNNVQDYLFDRDDKKENKGSAALDDEIPF